MNRHSEQLVSVVFRLERGKLKRLRTLAAASRIRQSEFLREAIGDLLAKHARTPSHPLEAPTPREIQLAWERSQLGCGCGRSYTWDEYFALPAPLRGSQQPTTDDSGAPIFLELRNCHCGSTMARLPGPCPKGWPL